MKKTIIGIMSVGLMFSALTSMQLTTPTFVNAKTTKSEFSAKNWHKGTPKMFHSGGHIWISTPQYTKEAKTMGAAYEQDVTKLSAKHVFNIYPFFFKANHQHKTTGADTSASAWVNPHYRKLGHNTYQITSGVYTKNSLYHELHDNGTMSGTTNLVKVVNHNQIKVWTYEESHGKLKLIDGETMYRYKTLPKQFHIYEFN